ncbi:MAG: gamma-glutamylcyclotransferase [Proteobacteria bacterium]|nr:gamma-glutamylcyclotransferase [Pseudomonadota bacterium]
MARGAKLRNGVAACHQARGRRCHPDVLCQGGGPLAGQDLSRFHYFAYGSNLLTGRLTASNRCPSARYFANAWADHFTLDFSKVGKDGSGKATLVPSHGKRAHGVIFEIDSGEREPLDRAEPGYRREDGFEVTVVDTGICKTVTTYIVLENCRNLELKPFDWYLALVVAGAMEHRFPAPVIEAYRDTAIWVDEDKKRTLEMDSLLQKAGFGSTRQVLGLS